MPEISRSWTVYFFSMVALILAATAPADAGSKVKFKACTVAPAGTPWEQQTKNMKKYIRKESQGEIRMKVYYGGAKGSAKECIEKILASELQMYGGTLSAMSFVIPELEVFDLPFLWTSTEEVDFVLDNHLLPVVGSVFRAGGFVFNQWAENGWHGIGTKGKFIKSPGDLKDLTIRSQPSIIHPLTWSTFGAIPVELWTSDVVDALESGKIVAYGNTPLFVFAAGWQTYITHFTLTQHLYQPGVLAFGKSWFDQQTPEHKKILRGRSHKGALEGRAGVRKIQPELIENFRSFGIKVYELTPVERQQFAKTAEKVRRAYEGKATPGATLLLKAIEKGKAAFKSK
ncbi:MAG: TRAP transporter substrate-binding protein DctP [Deltaproteobacteria bacterium]|nr:TRAP transporter substrate-binding protein DctP [Deltaproteobacteria bacterium]MBT6491785.1 TRAP transporter substrate-binding protein DctP [Deltaproteobacteria bacterium]